MPEVTVYDDGSWKSTHENDVPMFTELDCLSKAPGEFPFTAYSAVMAFPDDAPAMYATMSVTDPVVAAVKYEMDCALASFPSEIVPTTVFPKVIVVLSTITPLDDIMVCVELKAFTLNVKNEEHIMKQRQSVRTYCFVSWSIANIVS